MPSAANIHVSVPLTNVSVRYQNAAFIAREIFKPKPVDKETDKYYVVDAAREQAKIIETRRNRGAVAVMADWDFATSSYATVDHALAGVIPDEDRKNADVAIQADIEKTEALTDMLLLQEEKALATLLFSTSTFTSYYSGTAQCWDQTVANGGLDPIAARIAADASIAAVAGQGANTLILGKDVFDGLRKNPYIRAQFQYTTADSITEAMLARYLQIERVLVGQAFYNSAGKGVATPTMARIWPTEYALFAYIAPALGLRTVSLGATFCSEDIGPGGVRVESGRCQEPGRLSDWVTVHRKWDQRPISLQCGYLFSNCLGTN